MATSGFIQGEWRGKLEPVREYPANALNVSTRSLLGRFLDEDSKCYSGVMAIQKDWQGLAELMGFYYSEIQTLRQEQDKTVQLLARWLMNVQANIGQLLDFLERMERYDVLEDDIFQRRIMEDVALYSKRQRDQKPECHLVAQPVQIAEVDSHENVLDDYDSYVQDELSRGTSDDRQDQPEFFNALLCYTQNDRVFVKEAIKRLEGDYALKLCVPDRDVMPGCAKYTVLAHIIKTRCTKVVIILSKSWWRLCEDFDFIVKFGQALEPGARKKKLIPVLVEEGCPIPEILRFIVLIDFTKRGLGCFWDRLAAALRQNTDNTSILTRNVPPWSFDERDEASSSSSVD